MTEFGSPLRIQNFFFYCARTLLLQTVTLLFFTQLGYAQVSNSENRLNIKNLETTTTEAEGLKEAQSFFGQFRLERMQYLTEVPESPELMGSNLLSGRISGLDEVGAAKRFSYAMDITVGTYFDWNQSHFFVNELYARYDLAQFSADSSYAADISVGRRKFEWSELDTRWQLGLWQPKFALDALRPEDQGLTGIFLDQRGDKNQLLIMATPIFIPTMGPEIRDDGGSLQSNSRWYRAPSRSWDFNNQETPIVYRIDVPEAARLVNNPGLAGMYRWGHQDKGLRFSVGGAYKPVNDLILKRQNFQVITETQVSVSPEVTHHRIYATDLGYNWGPLGFSLSYLEDNPEEKRPEEDWIIQRLSPTRIYSAGLSVDFSALVNRPLQIQSSYLRAHGGEIQDIQFDGSSDDMNLFDSRLKFTNAVMTKVTGELARPYGHQLNALTNYIYDFDQRGSILSLELQLLPSEGWGLVVGTDLLGVEEETDSDKRFINQFRANDRYYGGMSYVF